MLKADNKNLKKKVDGGELVFDLPGAGVSYELVDGILEATPADQVQVVWKLIVSSNPDRTYYQILTMFPSAKNKKGP